MSRFFKVNLSLNDILRLILQLSLLLIYGKYLEEIISFKFLIFSFLLLNLLTYIFFTMNLRSFIALPLIFITPWLVRTALFLINLYDRSFLLISFDMNFYLILLPVYGASILTWFSLMKPNFRKYEVLINGFFLFLLFWKQSHYAITLVPNQTYLAIFAICFILMELLVLYLSIAGERKLDVKVSQGIKEISIFFLLLVPLLIYLLLPLWEIYEEGSVAGGGGLLKTSLFSFDFSEYIRLETEISMSDDLVLMFRKEGPAERMLLRRYVLSGYEKGKGFYRHDRDRVSPPDRLMTGFTEYADPDFKSREKVSQELFLVNIDPTVFLSMNYPINSQPIYNWDNSSFVRIYKSDAMVSTRIIGEIDPLISMNDDEFKHYTFTGEDENVKEMALEITEKSPGSLLKTMEIENYFHNNYFYSLKPGVAPDGDQLSYFINDSKKGYCSYFAFSMALLCRSIGIPARVAVGFWVDPDVSVLNFYPVRSDQAHAWVEVYFNDYGWIEFDPTSSVMYPGEQYPFASFTIDEFSPLIEEILSNDLIDENISLNQSDLATDGTNSSLWEMMRELLFKFWYILFLTAYVCYITIYRFAYRILSRLNGTYRLKTKYLYLHLRRKLSFERKKFGESISDYALRIESTLSIPLVDVTSLYQKSVFSQEYSQEDFNLFMENLNESIKVYRERIPKFERILYFLIPLIRSLHK